MDQPQEQGSSNSAQSTSSKLFNPIDLSQDPPIFSLPDELWTSMLETRCGFEPEYFQRVMLNLIKHPDIASTYLFRAEIFYDSFNDPEGKFLKHVKAEYQPLACQVPEYELLQTVVRRMIPRNPQRDQPLVQTCHVFKSQDVDAAVEKNLVIYLPHVDSPEEMPFYHPTVRALAFLHIWPTSGAECAPSGTFSIHYSLFPSQELTNRLSRTALSLLTLINKHGQGQKAGYQKRVHHDQIIPQARFQDTYTRLKTKYAKDLIANWVEQTPPGKHVFEDLGIAAFLLELWGDMYALEAGTTQAQEAKQKPSFPGFVDIGCGNGVLVNVLLQEGYRGWGFDARRRKTWDTFPASVQSHLKEMVLVPELFTRSLASSSVFSASTQQPTTTSADSDADAALTNLLGVAEHPNFHNGLFEPGTFIISNHADELTPWTPLLASLSRSPFIAIPCCSHNLAGARFRAPVQKPPKEAKEKAKTDGSQQAVSSGNSTEPSPGSKIGSLKQPKQPSAYATLCDWVERLARDVGFVPEKEMLRIPSTRNAGIVGRRFVESGEAGGAGDGVGDVRERMKVVRKVLVREMGGVEDAEGGLEVVGREWVERAGKLVKGQGGGH